MTQLARERAPSATSTATVGFRRCLLTVLVVASGCTITQTGTPLPPDPPITPGVTTRRELFDRYGLPSRIRYRREDQILIYNFSQGKGMGFGVGAFGILFNFSHQQIATDTLTVTIGPDGRVLDARTAQRTKKAGFWFWPFGS